MPLIGLTLTACALPGASGPSGFISTMHPTQEFCASRGLTLDMDTKECGTAPQPAAPLQTPSAESSNRVTASSNSGNGTATISIIITGPFCLITTYRAGASDAPRASTDSPVGPSPVRTRKSLPNSSKTLI